MVRAAGGVVVQNGDGDVRLVVVHRPEYDDWSLPKGKCESGESWEDCALREVEEETSLRCHLLGSVGTTEYIDQKGRLKQVRWWLMRPEDPGQLLGQTEVDQARWVTPAEAEEVLSYDRDRGLLRPLLKETRLWVVRHADAGARNQGMLTDRLRPLNDHGWEQAQRLIATFRKAGITRLASSPYTRCLQTLEPLASALQLPIEQVAGLGEGHGLDGLEPLLISGESVVACTHGDVLDALLGELRREGLASAAAKASTGSTWALRSRAGLIQAAQYLPPPA